MREMKMGGQHFGSRETIAMPTLLPTWSHTVVSFEVEWVIIPTLSIKFQINIHCSVSYQNIRPLNHMSRFTC